MVDWGCNFALFNLVLSSEVNFLELGVGRVLKTALDPAVSLPALSPD